MGGYRHGNSPRGRFLSGNGCPQCAKNDTRASKVEADVFTLLRFVLGHGERDLPVPGDRRTWLDMLFVQEDGLRLGIEYDGAYWHAGRESSDERKTQRIIGSGLAHEVVRVREDPLRAITRWDVLVPARPTAGVVAQTLLLHLGHCGLLPRTDVDETMTGLLTATRNPLEERDLLCEDCIRMLSYLVPYRSPLERRLNAARRR